jgi:hypothetical protein
MNDGEVIARIDLDEQLDEPSLLEQCPTCARFIDGRCSRCGVPQSQKLVIAEEERWIAPALLRRRA